MKTFAVASVLTLCSTAFAAPLQARHDIAKPFTLDVYFSNLPPVSGSLQANGGSFWIGKNTSSYCPDNVGDCPSGNSTSFVSDSNGALSLNTEVPGGQQVFIAPNGLLSYTSPHSSYIPTGSITSGLVVDADNNLLNKYYSYWVCSTDSAATTWQVWLEYRDDQGSIKNNGNTGDNACARINLVANDTESGAAAWQYS